MTCLIHPYRLPHIILFCTNAFHVVINNFRLKLKNCSEVDSMRGKKKKKKSIIASRILSKSLLQHVGNMPSKEKKKKPKHGTDS